MRNEDLARHNTPPRRRCGFRAAAGAAGIPVPKEAQARVMPDQASAQAQTSNIQVRLALERTRAAYDRTMMAWIRTATSLITFGFGVYKFFQLELKVAPRENQRIGAREFALLMVGAGISAMILGAFDHWRNMRAIRKHDPTLPRSQAGILAGLIMLIGVLALLAVIFRQ